MSVHEVVITGTGVAAALGSDVDTFWNAIRAGRSGIRTLRSIDLTDMAVTYGGEVDGVDPVAEVGHASARRLDRQTVLGVVAGRSALAEAGIAHDDGPWDGIAVVTATGYGPTLLTEAAVEALATKGPRKVSPNLTVYGSPDAPSAVLSQEFGLRGESSAVSAACASGTMALGEAMRMIRHGYTDAVLVVGAEATLTRKDLASTANTRALSTGFSQTPERASRPFDRRREGFVMAEGAAALLLESAASAAARRATPIATVLGYGATSDAFHVTAPHPTGDGAVRAIRRALADADLDPTAIDYVNAHGTSTELNDATELLAIATAFGQHAHRVPISSTKSMHGHLLGAAGVIEALITALALRDGVVPPTINLDEPAFEGFDLVPHRAREADLRTAMTNSFGFGGHNATLILGRTATAPGGR